MSAEQDLTILFADVVGSTQLYEEMGDEAARETVQSCVDIMKAATTEFNGTVIKTMGDEVMATFEDPGEAIESASQMQSRISDLAAADGSSVAIRIGCHYGSVVVEDNDVFGSAVHTANRMTSQAKARQIITTADTVELLNGAAKELVRQIGVTTPRGQTEEVALYEILWQPEDATSMLPEIDVNTRSAQVAGKLRLLFQGQEVQMGPDGLLTATLGRADDNAVTIKGNLISRLHARIDLKRSRFVLMDESSIDDMVQNGIIDQVILTTQRMTIMDIVHYEQTFKQ